ncbi:MAG: DUF4129 domain-containing protein [Chloroflexota bacterium]|nr:DUF4129 domain-containing protein [Chloroflexota bacterium]
MAANAQIKRLLGRIILLCLCLGFPLGARAQAATVPLEQYEQLVREAYAAATRSDRIGLDEVAAQLINIRDVNLVDGVSVPADNAWLGEALAQEPPPYRFIAARLGAILDAAGQTRAGHDPDALQKLTDVFSKPPFKSREVPSAWTQFWRAVGQAISDFFDWLFRSLPSGGNAGPAAPRPAGFSGLSPLGWVLLTLGLLLVLGIVVYAIRGVRQSVVRDAKARAEAALEDENITAGEALDRAQSQARSGDYRTAVRYLYLSSLLWLDERKLLRYDRSLTNREYLQRANTDPALHERLAPVVGTFERVWYGRRELAEADFLAYEEQIKGLRDMEPKP